MMWQRIWSFLSICITQLYTKFNAMSAADDQLVCKGMTRHWPRMIVLPIDISVMPQQLWEKHHAVHAGKPLHNSTIVAMAPLSCPQVPAHTQ